MSYGHIETQELSHRKYVPRDIGRLAAPRHNMPMGQRHYIKRYSEYLTRYGIRVRPLGPAFRG